MNFCTNCGQPRTADARFCTSCGTPFAAGAADESPPAPPEPQPGPQQPWQTPQETWAAQQQEPWAAEPGQPAEPDQPTALVEPAGPAPEANWAAPQDTVAGQQDTMAGQQDTWGPQQDTWGPQQETWAAPPGAGSAAEPGAGIAGQQGPGPEAGNDPFAHFFRDSPGQPTEQQGWPEPQGGRADQQGGWPNPPEAGYGPATVSQPPYPGGGPPGEEPQRRSRARAITLLAGVVVVLAAGGVGAWAALGGKGHPSAQSGHTAHHTGTPHSSSPRPSTSPPSSSPKPSATPSGMVAAAPGVTGKKGERTVLAFLDSYFTAINTHNYQKYYGLLDTQQQRDVTAGQFDSGYRKTRDSHATLVALGPAGGGVVAAAITFTSHQPASDSPSHTSCTNWNTTLYLRHQGGSYVIGAPPASYHASYQAC